MSTSVGGLHYDVTLEMRGMIDAQRQLDRRLGDMESRGDQFAGKFKSVAAAVTAALSAIAVDGLVSKVISAQRQFDIMFASLKTMTGGADQAGAAWERLVAFAATTPYSLEQAVQGFTKLKALGLDPSERSMTSFGNTAAAMGKDLIQMVEAVADASTGEFERLKEFGIKAKVEGDNVAMTFQGVTTRIANNSDSITEYLTKIGEVQFGGAMSERMKTLDGDISNLEDSMQALYLSISQSGFGDAIASSVRAASEAVQQATLSIKEGGLTEYFDAIKPYAAAAEVAIVSLAGAITGKLVLAMAEAAVKAYATAAATGAATIAANGFTAALTLMGGPIGIAITALALIALNWDKIAGSAQNAAQISENAAARIAGAQRKTADRAKADLQGQLTDAQKDLAETEKKLAAASKKSIYGGTVSPKKDIDELQARRDAYIQASADIKKAMDGLGGASKNIPEAAKPPKQPGDPSGWMAKYATKAEQLNAELKKAKDELGANFTPELEGRIREKFSEKKGGGGSRGGGAAKDRFDDAGYLAGLRKSTADGYAEIGLMEEKALADNNKRLAEKQISEATHQEAVTLIQADFEQRRMDFRLTKMRESNSEAETIREQDIRAEQEAFEKEQALKRQRKSVEMETLQIKADGGGAQDRINLIIAQAQAEIAAVESMRLLDLEASQIYADQKLAIESKMQQDILDLREAANAQAYSSQAEIFSSLAGIAKDAAGEQSGIYKAMFAASKAFAIAEAIVKIQAGIANAAAMPWPLNLGAMASVVSATAGIVSTISSTSMSGGRQYGGPVSAGSMYRVNEKGAPEMFTAGNGQQYMMPTAGGQVTAADQVGGSVQWKIIVNNSAPGATVKASVDDQSKTVTLAVNEVASQIRANSGPVWSAMRGSSNVQGRMS